MSTSGTPSIMVLPTTVTPVDPSMIKTARLRLGPANLLLIIRTLDQRRRFTAWKPLFAHMLFSKVIDGESGGAPLLPLWSPVAIRHCASTLRQVLSEITTSNVGGLFSS